MRTISAVLLERLRSWVPLPPPLYYLTSFSLNTWEYRQVVPGVTDVPIENGLVPDVLVYLPLFITSPRV